MTTKRVEGHALFLARLAEAYLLAGRIEEAHTTGRQAVELSCETGERGHEAYTLWLLGEVASREPSTSAAAAEASYGLALARAEELGMRPLLAHCLLGLGKLGRRAGTAEQAHERINTATTMYREMGMTYWVEQATAELKEGGRRP